MAVLGEQAGAEAEREGQSRRRKAEAGAAVRRLHREIVAQRARRVSRRSGAPRPRSRRAAWRRDLVAGLGDEVEGREIGVRSAAPSRCRPGARPKKSSRPAPLPPRLAATARADSRRSSQPAAAGAARRPRRDGPAVRLCRRDSSSRQHEGVHLVLDEVEAVAARRHGDAEQIAAARRLLRLVGVDPARADLLAALRDRPRPPARSARW